MRNKEATLYDKSKVEKLEKLKQDNEYARNLNNKLKQSQDTLKRNEIQKSVGENQLKVYE